MTQETDQTAKIAELNALFAALDERGQESALTTLRTLRFAQSVPCVSPPDEPPPPPLGHSSA